MELTKSQLDTLRHMLGINTPYDRVPKPYRNYYAATPGDAKLLELEQLGAVERYEPCSTDSYDWYRCSEEGKRMAMRSHRDIRHKKAHRRYAAYLDMTDIYSELTFKDFLTHPGFKKVRDRA